MLQPQVEVTEIDVNKFFIRVFCEHKPGGLVRLLGALSSLGLEVTNVNVTSCRMLVSNVFEVEVTYIPRTIHIQLLLFSKIKSTIFECVVKERS